VKADQGIGTFDKQVDNRQKVYAMEDVCLWIIAEPIKVRPLYEQVGSPQAEQKSETDKVKDDNIFFRDLQVMGYSFITGQGQKNNA